MTAQRTNNRRRPGARALGRAAARPLARLALAGAAGLALLACGDADVAAPAGAAGGPPDAPALARSPGALLLEPDVRVVGLGDIYAQLQITHLSFDAELFLLPESEATPPASVTVRYRFDAETGPATEVLAQALSLAEAGRYQVLVRIRPNLDDGIAVRVAGAVEGDLADRIARAKDDATPDAEPAPTPARGVDEPAPTPAEPAPTPADDPREPAPTPAREFEEPAPTPAEPAPTPARGADEPAPTPARGKGDTPLAPLDERETVFVRSTLAHEFFAGQVDVQPGDRTLVVTWDARRWLRGVLARPLGLGHDAEPVEALPDEVGFQRTRGDEFRLDAR